MTIVCVKLLNYWYIVIIGVYNAIYYIYLIHLGFYTKAFTSYYF